MFSVYVLFLILSGIMMLAMAFIRTDYAKRRQLVNFIFGTGFLIYGLYLLLVFHGGTYFMFYYVFLLPVAMGYHFFRDRSAAKAKQMAANPPAGTPWAAGAGAGNTQGAGSTQGGGYAQGDGYQGGSDS